MTANDVHRRVQVTTASWPRSVLLPQDDSAALA